MSFFIGIGEYRLDMVSCASLKDKRRILKSITDRLGRSGILGISEVGASDYWKSGVLAVACVSSSRDVVMKALDNTRRTVEGYDVFVVSCEQKVLKWDDLEELLSCQDA